MAPTKTELQRKQKLWELQRPHVGPINTYKCLSKQSFNGGYSTEMGAWPLLKKQLFFPKDWVGGEGEEVLCWFLREILVQRKTNTQYSKIHHRLIYSKQTNKKRMRNKVNL